MSKQSTNALSEEEYNALLEEQQRQNDEVSFYEQSKHEAACHAPLASNEPCKYSWADARAVIEAETEARESDYESDYEHGYCCSICDGDDQDEPTYDCKWCKDGEDTTAPCICNADRREEHARQAEELAAACAQAEIEAEAKKYADALDRQRALFENDPLRRKGYGPFMNDMIIAYAKCDLKFPEGGKDWWNELEKHEVIHQYRGWWFSKISGSISAGW